MVDASGTDAGASWPQDVDRRLLGLRIEAGEPPVVRFVLEPALCRRDGALFGGTALAATLASFELASGRPSLWATVQFVASAAMGEEIECRATSVARGRAVDQMQLTASVGDRLVFSAVGATASPRPDGIAGAARTMPAVPPPEACEGFGPGSAGTDAPEVGHYLVSEFREAPLAAAAGPGHVAMWARVTGEVPTSAAKLGFLADMVPIAVCRSVGVEGAGTSLDNSIRVAQLVDTEWVLVELEAQGAHGGYGYGVSHLWAPDGTLMATGSQTAKLFSFESFLRRMQDEPER